MVSLASVFSFTELHSAMYKAGLSLLPPCVSVNLKEIAIWVTYFMYSLSSLCLKYSENPLTHRYGHLIAADRIL